MTNWKQPTPTKKFAVWYDGGWYGEGDTPTEAWDAAMRHIGPQYHPMNLKLWEKIRRHGVIQETPNKP